METITSNAKAIELTGEEVRVHFTSAFPYFWLRNDGSWTVLMSLSPNIEEGGDGVIEVLAGSSAGTMHGYNSTRSDFYISGSGRVQIMATHTPENPFRKAEKGGDDDDILLSMPLAHDLSDISGFDRVITYIGDTPLTITPEEGIFLYKGHLRVNADFLTGIPKFAVEFDIKINQTSVTGVMSLARQAIVIYGKKNGVSYGIGCVVRYNNASSPNALQMLHFDNTQMIDGKQYTSKSYYDGKYHHIALYYDSMANFVYITVDGTDLATLHFDYGATDYVYWGRNDNYGLNGYVKNVVIRKLK